MFLKGPPTRIFLSHFFRFKSFKWYWRQEWWFTLVLGIVRYPSNWGSPVPRRARRITTCSHNHHSPTTLPKQGVQVICSQSCWVFISPVPRAAFPRVVSSSVMPYISPSVPEFSGLKAYLNHLPPNLFSTLTHSNGHVAQHGWMAYIRGITVALDICWPLMAGGVRMARSNIACLQGLELLRCTKLISLKEVSMGIGKSSGFEPCWFEFMEVLWRAFVVEGMRLIFQVEARRNVVPLMDQPHFGGLVVKPTFQSCMNSTELINHQPKKAKSKQ
jgi:hypothetical protein